MDKKLIKYISPFLLFLFLFPIAEKNIHAFEHLTDVYCSANSKHFHGLEHNCPICDFSIDKSNSPINSRNQFVLTLCRVSFNSFIESVNTPCAFQDLPSRAPPVA